MGDLCLGSPTVSTIHPVDLWGAVFVTFFFYNKKSIGIAAFLLLVNQDVSGKHPIKYCNKKEDR